MSDADTVFATAAETGLLGRGTTDDERRRNAARFTRIVAWRLRDGGWGNIRHESPSAVNGLSADKIMRFPDGLAIDIVFASEGPNAAPQWSEYGYEHPDRWRAPQPDEPPAPSPAPPGEDFAVRLTRVETKVQQLLAWQERLAAAMAECASQLDELRLDTSRSDDGA